MGVGVLAIIIRNNIQIVDHNSFSTNNMEGITAEIPGKHNNLTIINVYFPQGKFEDED